jgi:hypothetical protein
MSPAWYTKRQTREAYAMSAPTVRISEASHQILKELAEHTGKTMMDVLDKALDTYRRTLFFEQLNAGYAEFRADPKAWAEHQAERKLWDATLMDGLDSHENWTERAAVRPLRMASPEPNRPACATRSVLATCPLLLRSISPAHP